MFCAVDLILKSLGNSILAQEEEVLLRKNVYPDYIPSENLAQIQVDNLGNLGLPKSGVIVRA